VGGGLVAFMKKDPGEPGIQRSIDRHPFDNFHPDYVHRGCGVF
jgi:hypothetical protein